MIYLVAYLLLGLAYVGLDVASVWESWDSPWVAVFVISALTPVWPAWILWKHTRVH